MVYSDNTARNSAPDNMVRYGPKTSRFYTVYCRKGSVFTAFTVRFRVGTLFLEVERLNQSLKDKLNFAKQAVAAGLTQRASDFITGAQQIHEDLIDTMEEIKKKSN
jgi:hypothetical protein